jgi:hypothetical protein
VAVIALLILTALGNAALMLVVSVAGLALFLLAMQREDLGGALFVAACAFAAAIAIAVVMLTL